MNQTKNKNISEWRIPFVNKIVRAEIRRSFQVVFTLVDYNSGSQQCLGFWEAGKWEYFRYYNEEKANRMRRLMFIIGRRYKARVNRIIQQSSK